MPAIGRRWRLLEIGTAHRRELRAGHLAGHVARRVEPPPRVALVPTRGSRLAEAPRRRGDAVLREPAEQRPVDRRPLLVAAVAVEGVGLVEVGLGADVERRQHVPVHRRRLWDGDGVHRHDERHARGLPVGADRDRAPVRARAGAGRHGHADVERLIRPLGRPRRPVPRHERVGDEPAPELDEVAEVELDGERAERASLDGVLDVPRARDDDPGSLALAGSGVERDRPRCRPRSGRTEESTATRGTRGRPTAARRAGGVAGHEGARGCECCCEGGGAAHAYVVAALRPAVHSDGVSALRTRGAGTPPAPRVPGSQAVVARTRSRPVR